MPTTTMNPAQAQAPETTKTNRREEQKRYLAPDFVHERSVSGAISTGINRSVELSFSSETPVTRYDWWEDQYYSEILGHSEGNVDLKRLAEVGVMLWNHNYNTPIARVEAVTLDSIEKKCRAVVRFDEDEESERLYQKVLSGTLRCLSVGYRVLRWEKVDRDTTTTDGFKGPAMIAREWEPIEISLVSVPADTSVGIGRSIKTNEEELRIMAEPNKTTAVTAPEPGVSVEDARRVAEAAERERAAEITALCRDFGRDAGEYITGGTPVEEVRRAILEQVRAERTPVMTSGRAEIIEEDRDKYCRAVVDGLRMRSGGKPEKPAAGAEEFRSISLFDVARESLVRRGERVRYNEDPLDVVKRAYTTDDFPLIIGGVARATLMEAYSNAPVTWCDTGSLSDFKKHTTYKLSATDDLDLVPEGGEYAMASFEESEDSIRLYTYGRIFSMSRQAIINDDLRALTLLPRRFGHASARTINKAVYAIIVANNVKIGETGNVLFHANHKNIGTAGAISTTTLSEARTMMRKHTDMSGKEKLNIYPTYLLVPPELETTAEQVLGSTADINGSHAGVLNPFRNRFQIISDAELSSATNWFMAAMPNLVDTIEVAFLNGNASPRIEQQPGWKVDGMDWKISLDFGVKAWDYRGLFKNAGA